MKIIFQILIILLVAATISICVTKPNMHKAVLVYNSDYIIVPEQKAEVVQETIPIMEIPAQPKKTETRLETKVSTSPQVKTVTKSVASAPETQLNSHTVTKTQVKQTKPISETKVQITTTPLKETVTEQTAQNEIKQETVTVVKKEEPKVLTQQEEEIAWNIWRSNLQNKLMQDVKLPTIPTGIVFKFTFSVDKYGKVSNVQTWSTTSAYTPYAIQYIAPVIRSYQGKSILNFPDGSSRTITEVTGGWKISTNEKYSTPADYNDIEKVVK